uniref:Uncharacterized protein n=1 Tax=Castor canadensis TaxID=51338 RepID=A0A8C0VUI4_CASCN
MAANAATSPPQRLPLELVNKYIGPQIHIVMKTPALQTEILSYLKPHKGNLGIAFLRQI